MTTQRYLFFLLAMSGLLLCLSSSTLVNPKNKDSLVYGIDISHYQNDEIDYLNNKSDQLTFVICKATEGVTLTDPDFQNNWKMIEENGFVRGAYHFYHCADDPKQQAAYFLKTVGKLSKIDFPLIVDFEENSIDKSCNKADIQKNLLLFLNLLEQQTGRKPILYTDTNTGNAQITDPAFAEYCLWIADYNTGTTPKIPAVWKGKDWLIWQKNPSYSLDTYSNDYDVFNGSETDFLKFLQGN
nr:GH25 family lysozyme [uncultured Flavobacterium sp.]